MFQRIFNNYKQTTRVVSKIFRSFLFTQNFGMISLHLRRYRFVQLKHLKWLPTTRSQAEPTQKMLDRSSSFFVISVVEDHDLAKGEFFKDLILTKSFIL